MYQVLLLSDEQIKTETCKQYGNLQISQITRQDTLIGFFPNSAPDALIICKEFEKHPVVPQVEALAKECMFIHVGVGGNDAALRVQTVREALAHLDKLPAEPRERRLPLASTISFLKTLTNPAEATKLDEQILELFPDYQFFACIVETVGHRPNLLTYVYYQIIALGTQCLGYRFAKEKALYIVYAEHSVTPMRKQLKARFASADPSAFRAYFGTEQRALTGVYTSFFEAYETLYIDTLLSPCTSFEQISDFHNDEPVEIKELEHQIFKSMMYHQGRDVVPLVLQWFERYRNHAETFANIQCEAINLYSTIKRIILEHYVLKPRRIKKGFEAFEIINISDYEALKTWFVVWLDYTLTDFAKARNKAPKFTLESAYQFIEEHIFEDCSLTNLAEYFDLTSQYVSRLFKQNSGRTFQSYVTEQKMKKAQELLSRSESLQETAIRLGYSDEKYFRFLLKHHEEQSQPS